MEPLDPREKRSYSSSSDEIPPPKKKKRKSYSDRQILEKQQEMLTAQTVACENKAMLYSRMMLFFDKAIKLVDTVMKKPPEPLGHSDAYPVLEGDPNLAESVMNP
ncbi:hypothetical protein OESDEN_03102 [Oesophagostomum dentatum]|uniref:Uncharacterized protein n=1 Tax=Oesophagostomum dentatum TaxID=61180 RepID=A0A0B1TH91_OESDE|nr:hypothetical protein OESDEN_03102 [Oesophagostomum dentatum]